MTPTILLIEDDSALRRSLAQTFELADLSVIEASSLLMAKATITAEFEGVVLSDIRMPGKDGFDVLEFARDVDPELPVVMLTGQADVPMAVRAMSEGAYDFRQKPCPPDQLLEVIERAMRHRELVLKARRMERRLQSADAAAVNFPGQSTVSQTLRENLRQIASLPIHSYLHGAPGSGKRLAAHTIHALSSDSDRFVALSMRDVAPAQLDKLETGQGAMHLSIKDLDQARSDQEASLLSLMERNPQIRVIASSPLPLEALRQKGLSDDLFYAFEMMQIEVPSLGNRKEDIPAIFEALVRQTVRAMNGDMPDIPESVLADVMAREWPGNLPELRNFARSFALGLDRGGVANTDSTLADQMTAFEKLVISEALRRHQGRTAAAAAALGLPPKTLYDKLTRHELRAKDFR